MIEKFNEEFFGVEVEKYTDTTFEIRLRYDDGSYVTRLIYVDSQGKLVYSGD